MNATRHGLLATKAPVIGEDALKFQQFMEELIGEFQPESPTEITLLEQVAMARIRLYRLWMTESALASHALTPAPPLEPPTVAKYPYYEKDDYELKNKTLFHPDNRALERELSLVLLETLKIYRDLDKDVRKKYFNSIWSEWLGDAEKTITKFLYQHPFKSISVNPLCYSSAVEYANACQEFLTEQKEKQTLYGEVSQLQVLIRIAQQDLADEQYPKTKNQLRCSIVKFQIDKVEQKCREKLNELEKIEKEIIQVEKEHQKVIADYQDLTRRSQVIRPQIELLSRYERHIVKIMNEALDRLQAIRQQRQQANSMGSFRNCEVEASFPGV
ncbi:MAG: hypothetical protein KME32_00590 [Mojavia pulchra JT2-VF2]|jgi:predicted transcriptional regulator|uniref:Uncharacterized protein n=1 Tax=Mojavia pulchra JT2-VF2 TaxID=287848 RepID=A0A951PV93_9NOST|nr:hypothetical protein [Mojavia pulchra JT2-VF2]